MRFLNTIDRPVQSWMTDRAFCFCLALAILMVSDVAISTDDSEGVVLAKVMKAGKEIRPDNKKREGAPPRLGAGRLPSGGGTDAGRAPRRADDGGTVSRRRRSPADGGQKERYLIGY